MCSERFKKIYRDIFNNFPKALKIENCAKIMVGLTQSRIFFAYYFHGNMDCPTKCILPKFNLFSISVVIFTSIRLIKGRAVKS